MVKFKARIEKPTYVSNLWLDFLGTLLICSSHNRYSRMIHHIAVRIRAKTKSTGYFPFRTRVALQSGLESPDTVTVAGLSILWLGSLGSLVGTIMKA